jgi:hypothetical protein
VLTARYIARRSDRGLQQDVVMALLFNMNSLIRIQIHLFVSALPLNLTWEVAQIYAYEFPETTLIQDVIGCFIPTLGDGLMTLIIFWIGLTVFRDSKWILAPGVKGYVLMLAVGLLLAVIVEWNAFRTGAWGYNEQMITIPILGVGLLPILQMLLLPPATAVLVQRIWRRRENRSAHNRAIRT